METFSNLVSQSQTYCLNDTSSSTLSFIKSELNKAQRFVFAELQDYIVVRTQTSATVSNQQYYHFPPDNIHIETVMITINNVNYTMTPVDSQREWDRLNAIQVQPTALPEFFFERPRDFGIWPIPQGVYTITLNYQYMPIDMTQNDYATGTLNLTNNDVNVTGVGTTFTQSMVGSYLTAVRPSGDGQWYKVVGFNSVTELILEEAYQGLTATGLTYNIGETPEVPVETHELLPYRVAYMYFMVIRKDPAQATYFNNLFWTGDPTLKESDTGTRAGFNGVKNRYAKRSVDRVIRQKYKTSDLINTKLFATTITS